MDCDRSPPQIFKDTMLASALRLALTMPIRWLRLSVGWQLNVSGSYATIIRSSSITGVRTLKLGNNSGRTVG